MYEYFFRFVDAVPENVFFLNGTAVDYEAECSAFEEEIKRIGGLRLVCCEVDSEAAIGGNTPGSCLTSKTRQKTRTSFIINDRFHTRNGLLDYDYEEEAIDEAAMGSKYVLTMGLRMRCARCSSALTPRVRCTTCWRNPCPTCSPRPFSSIMSVPA